MPGQDSFPVSRIVGVDWTTSATLKTGDQDFSPALLISVAGVLNSDPHSLQAASLCLHKL